MCYRVTCTFWELTCATELLVPSGSLHMPTELLVPSGNLHMPTELFVPSGSLHMPAELLVPSELSLIKFCMMDGGGF
jgi:hypothetical protein